MASLPNPWGQPSPIGNATANLMRAMFGGNADPSKADYQRAAAAKMNADAQLQLNKNAALSNIGNLVQGVATGPTPEMPHPDPGFVGPMPAMNRSDYLTSQLGPINSAGLRAGLNPTQIGQLVYQTAKEANLPTDQVARYYPNLMPLNEGVTLEDRNNLIAQKAQNDTNRAIATEQAKPVSVSPGSFVLMPPEDPRGTGKIQGNPTLQTVRGGVAQDAVQTGNLSPIGRTILGSGQGTPRNYVTQDGKQGITLDGTTDAATGQAIPAGARVYTGQLQTGNMADLTTGMKTNVQQSELQLNNFRSTLNHTYQIANSDPTLFGITGNGRRLAQDVMQQVENVGLLAGKHADINSALNEIRQKVKDTGYANEMFDANLPAVSKLSTLLAYSAASAVAGQSGRSVSDQDVKHFKELVGDPTSWLASQKSFLAGLHLLDQEATARINLLRDAQNKPHIANLFGTDAQNPGQGQTPAAPAAGAPQPGEVQDGYRFRGGNPADPNSWEKAQ